MDSDSEGEVLSLLYSARPPWPMRSRRGKGSGKGMALEMYLRHTLRSRWSRFHRRDRRLHHLQLQETLKEVRPREKGGPCIIKRTVQGLLSSKIDGDSSERIFHFLGPGCDVQLHVTPEFTFDKALQEVNRHGGRCCGIWLCAGSHRARTRLLCPLTVLGPSGPSKRDAQVMAAEWTIASEYLSLQSLKVVPPSCIRQPFFHTLLKVCAGNLHLKDCDFQASQLCQQRRQSWSHLIMGVAAEPELVQVQTVGAYCIKVHKAAQVHVENCHFTAAQSTALDLRCPEVTVLRCTFDDCGSAIDCGLHEALKSLYPRACKASRCVRVLQCRFENCGRHAAASQTGDVAVGSRPAVLVRKQLDQAIVKDCSFQNVSDAIATNCTATILANQITVADTAIWVGRPGELGETDEEFDEDAPWSRRTSEASARYQVSEISENRLDCCMTGILATHIPQVHVAQNRVDNTMRSIYLLNVGRSDGDASRVEANTVTRSSSTAILLSDVKGGSELQSNVVQNCRRGIVLECNGEMVPFTITDNDISGALSGGIEVIGKSRMWSESPGNPQPSDFVEFRPEDWAEQEDEGPRVTTVTGTIANNSVRGCGRGLLLQDVSALVEGNLLAKNNGWAIHLDLRFLDEPKTGPRLARSSVLRNTVLPMTSKSGRPVAQRGLRLSVGGSAGSALPRVAENRSGAEELLPMMKRRKLE